MQQVNIKIIMRDTALAVGLRHLLHNLFDIEAKRIDEGQLAETDTAATDLFIADSRSFASCIGFFIPRRTKLILLTDGESAGDGSIQTLNRFADEQTFVARLTQIVEAVREKAEDGNELSQREIDVLCLVASGMTNKEIADKLCISINTVLSHRKNITSKLGIRSASGLSVYAMMNGYISPTV